MGTNARGDDPPPVEFPELAAGSSDEYLEVEKGFKESTEESFSEPEPDTRTGTWFTGLVHIINAVVGTGVLSLGASLASLGWAAGIICLLVFGAITWYCALLLAQCHVVAGKRYTTYLELVEGILGRRAFHSLASFQLFLLYFGSVSYLIVGAQSLQQVAREICNLQGKQDCFDSYWRWACIFGAMQIIVALVPSIRKMHYLSLFGTIMAASYSLIALGLSIGATNHHGTVGGVSESRVDKAFGVVGSFGNIFFAYSFSIILPEVQDAIKDRPGVGVIKPMQKAINVGMAVMMGFYIAIATASYMAIGNSLEGNILQAFTSPRWLIILSGLAVSAHVLTILILYLLPVLTFFEDKHNNWRLSPLSPLVFRLSFRIFCIVFITFLAICIPFFGDIIGLVGALGFWPLTVFFPIECWIRVYKPSRRRKGWLRALSAFCFLCSVVSCIGSVYYIVVDSVDYKVFSGS